MNNGTISGRLGKDPEVFAPNNSEYSCLKFSIANNDESKKDASGNYESVTSWFNVEFWTKKPAYWLKKLYKGTEISTAYKLKENTWEKDGQKRSMVILKIPQGEFPLIIAGKNETQSQAQTDNPPF